MSPGGASGPAAARRPVRPDRWWFPTLAAYDRSLVPRDVVAGLSAGAVVVPQALAYATIAGLPVEVGLYTCLAPLVVYAALGGSRVVSMSSTSTVATLTATTLVSTGVAAGTGDAMTRVGTLTALVGLVLVAARVLHLGRAVENINAPTLTGIQIGVGATVVAGQLPALLGVTSDYTGHGFLRSVTAVVEALPQTNVATAVLSLTVLVVLVGLQRWVPRFPAALVAVVGSLVLIAVTDLDDRGVALISPVPRGVPLPHLPALADAGTLLPGALAIALMAFLETSAVARGMRRPDDPRVDPDRELLATGMASVVGSFSPTLAAGGGLSQGAVNRDAGSRSQLSSLVTAGLALLVALALAPVLSLLPRATLAAVVVVSGGRLMDPRQLTRLWRIDRLDFTIAAATAATGLSVGLLPAVAAGFGVTVLAILAEAARVQLVTHPLEGAVLGVRLDGPLFGANVRAVGDAVVALVDEHEGVRVVRFDVSRLRVVTVTILDGLADLDRELESLGVRLELVGVVPRAATVADRTPWFRRLRSQGRVRDS